MKLVMEHERAAVSGCGLVLAIHSSARKRAITCGSYQPSKHLVHLALPHIHLNVRLIYLQIIMFSDLECGKSGKDMKTMTAGMRTRLGDTDGHEARSRDVGVAVEIETEVTHHSEYLLWTRRMGDRRVGRGNIHVAAHQRTIQQCV